MNDRIAANAEERDEGIERMLDPANIEGDLDARIEQATRELAEAFRRTAREWVEVNREWVEVNRSPAEQRADTFPPPEPPEDRYWITEAQWRVIEHRLNAVAENAHDGGAAIESFEVRPATADDRYSMLTVGEIVHNVVVSGWSEGKSFTTIEAIGQSGESYGDQTEGGE